MQGDSLIRDQTVICGSGGAEERKLKRWEMDFLVCQFLSLYFIDEYCVCCLAPRQMASTEVYDQLLQGII